MIASVAVVVPAKDERDEIRGAVESIMAARKLLDDASAGRIITRVVVVLDDCRDASAEVVAELPGVEAVTCRHGSVGAARRAGADHVLPAGAPDSLWLANTDADSRVPADWLVRMLEHADAGADLVLGTVRPCSSLSDTVMRAWLAAHDLGEDHRHVHGANLGIRASSYAELGGWSPLPSHEDLDLVIRAERSGKLAIRRPDDLVVITSSRRNGRAPGGFAGYLAALEESVGEAG